MTTTWRKPRGHTAYLLLPSVSLDISTVRNGQPTLQPGFYKAVQTSGEKNYTCTHGDLDVLQKKQNKKTTAMQFLNLNSQLREEKNEKLRGKDQNYLQKKE